MDIEVVSGLGPDGQIQVANESGIPLQKLTGDRAFRELASQLSRWVDRARAGTGRSSMFDRGAYTPPDNPYDEMRAARNALRYDDIVSGVAETTEAYAFQGIKWESSEPDEADVFNQMAAEQNLDAVLRSMWREEFGCSQTAVGKVWGWRNYTVRGKTSSGNARKRKFKVWAPVSLSTLDIANVVPVGMGPLAGQTLAWQATPYEIDAFQTALDGSRVDPLMLAFFDGPYEPDPYERAELAHLGVQPDRLLKLNSDYVFRHTLTKASYERFADVRLKSCFRLLDLKQQLINADRAMLIGAANYILLIRKGDEKHPAVPGEIEHLKENYSFITKLPVIISDHRLQIDIIAPKTDFTLDHNKYDVLDSRLLGRLLGTLTIGHTGGGRSDNQTTLSQAVARVMENRRHMLRRTLEKEIALAVVNHPKNQGIFQTTPSLVYTPANIALSLDDAYIQALIALRTQREISRETVLEAFGLDQAAEAMRLEIEDELYDDIFKTIALPGAAPVDGGADTKDGANTDPASTPASGQPATGQKRSATPNGTGESPAVSGARGGRPKGGGKTSGSPAKKAAPRSPNGNVKTD